MFGRQRFLATLSLELLPFLLPSFAVEPIASPDSVLIRPIAVYQSLIKGVHDYFNNTCVILLRGSSKPIEDEGENPLEGGKVRTCSFSIRSFQEWNSWTDCWRFRGISAAL